MSEQKEKNVGLMMNETVFEWQKTAEGVCRHHGRTRRGSGTTKEERTLMSSPIPQSVRSYTNEEGRCVRPAVMMGIDEAGRGPVLGPMIYGAAYWRIEDDEIISKLGYDDSKALSKEKRDEFFEGIVEKNGHRIGWILRTLSAAEISANSLGKVPVSLNKISHAAAIEMIQHAVRAGVNVRHVYIDTVGNSDVYERMLDRVFSGSGIQFTVRKKADSLFPVVSAASICAKVIRDFSMDNWHFPEPCVRDANKDLEHGYMGCGYPGDAKTKAWLAKNMNHVFGFPSIVRFNWSTAQDLIEKEKCAEVKWFDPAQQGQPSIMSFLGNASKKRKRPKYFETRGMSVVKSF